MLGLPIGLFPSGFPAKTLYAFYAPVIVSKIIKCAMQVA